MRKKHINGKERQEGGEEIGKKEYRNKSVTNGRQQYKG